MSEMFAETFKECSTPTGTAKEKSNQIVGVRRRFYTKDIVDDMLQQ